jgi:hypothetical protein
MSKKLNEIARFVGGNLSKKPSKSGKGDLPGKPDQVQEPDSKMPSDHKDGLAGVLAKAHDLHQSLAKMHHALISPDEPEIVPED